MSWHCCSLPTTTRFFDHEIARYSSLRQDTRGGTFVNRQNPNQEVGAVDRDVAQLACARHCSFKNFPSPSRVRPLRIRRNDRAPGLDSLDHLGPDTLTIGAQGIENGGRGASHLTEYGQDNVLDSQMVVMKGV